MSCGGCRAEYMLWVSVCALLYSHGIIERRGAHVSSLPFFVNSYTGGQTDRETRDRGRQREYMRT